MPRVRPRKSVKENARRTLTRLLRRYTTQGRDLLRNHASEAQLHAFRIQTKRVRYILELYAEVFPRQLRRAKVELRALQQILGDFQDQTLVRRYMEQRLARVRTPRRQAEYQRLFHKTRVRLDSIRKRFFARWRQFAKLRLEKRIMKHLS